MKMGIHWSGLMVLSLMLATSPSWAESVADKTAAEALFQEGVKLLREGDFVAACKKLEDSQRIDPGIGTLLNLADCYEKSGRTASAWATFREAASLARNAGHDDRAQLATERADHLEAQLSRLAITVAPETQALEGLEVRRGEELVSPAVFQTPIPVDPGKHHVTATAPGYLPFEVEVEVGAKGAAASATIPVLAVDPDATQPEPAPEAAVAPPPPAPDKPKGRAQRTTGVVLGGLGLAGIGVGSVFGLMAIDSNKQAFDPNGGNCGEVSCPPGDGNDLIDQAYAQATVSTVAFIAGGALLATGAVLYLSAPRAMEPQVTRLEFRSLGQGGAVLLGGTF